MEKTNENSTGILNIIGLLSERIGDDNMEYIEYYFTERGYYKVVLSDGSTIEIHKQTVADAECSIESITEETLLQIKNTLKRPE